MKNKMILEELSEFQKQKLLEFGVNSWFVIELLNRYTENPELVSATWREFFQSLGIKPSITTISHKGNGTPVSKKKIHFPIPDTEDDAVPIKGVAEKLVENMDNSLTIPVATSLRTIPVKLLEENRRLINYYLQKQGLIKVSYTHLVGWAIVKAIPSVPNMNNAFSVIDKQPILIKRKHINIGLAVDVVRKDGSRSLIVPNIKNAERMTFQEFYEKYNDIIERARTNKIELEDFQQTTISLTNPGTIGTVSSSPRLMVGQGAIIATGAIDYPPGFQGVSQNIISNLGLSKIMNITSTYDHRIIQGAESGLFLKKIHELLIGEDNFYDEIFDSLEIPQRPLIWQVDRSTDTISETANIVEIEKQAKTLQMINMYRVRGHLIANTDPLSSKSHYHPELDPVSYGFTVWDYDREFITDGLGGLRTAKLRDILEMLHQTYCEKIGVEYRHIQDPEEKLWLQNNMEVVRNQPVFNSSVKKRILEKLIEAESFEHFIDKKYIGHKRFSLEGSETLIPTLDFLLSEAANDSVKEVVIGMAHRGRLNVLANIIRKPLYAIFSEFEDIVDLQSVQGSGDVKYHLGASGIYKTNNDFEIKVTLASNPSHLEFVNPVVEGIVRAKQTRADDREKSSIIPVLLHGDAAFAGEGIVAETLNLSQLQGYSTGGTIHIIINNQIGFTTSPAEARSTVYASDVAKMVQAPIFHVNGDDPEAALWVTKLAYEYRMKFKKDVVIDIITYRRLGHNETDEPAFTQPLLYKVIRSHPSVKQIYEEKLIKERVLTKEDISKIESVIQDKMNSEHKLLHSKEVHFESNVPLAVDETEIVKRKTNEPRSLDYETLMKILRGLTELPLDFHLHPKLKKFIDLRKLILNGEGSIDWALAESLAFGSFLLDGIPVRLSGQDSSRGTFSQRHLIFVDVENGNEYIPLNHIASGQALIEPLDSLLSEAAVLGFEFGYSVADPISLVIWEAQFGDFANAAQVIIDNFISSSYVKWGLRNNLVMLLPHGQEGQGPEHSSARLERFLLLCSDGNMEVCNPTLPSQYYHLLRRHIYQSNLRPLVIMTPKSLLRHPLVKSDLNEFLNGKFITVIDDNAIDRKSVKKVILTSGKVYYDLLAYRTANKIDNTAIVRLEQYYPFPKNEIEEILSTYPEAKKFVWVQEEPENMGAMNFMRNRLLKEGFLRKFKFSFVSRKSSPSPAPGSYKSFQETQNKLLQEAFNV
ncbi:MAG: multifunctional oxoglutarate decarboxylase/oxoglutarate dehydrogenase thiamine pyrophosphate-binding subunit/dihydrolipoyllysine-residue succinyltransferase subunit [Ignavibacteria bacterium]